MAKKDNKIHTTKTVRNTMERMQDMLNALHKDTYYTSTMNTNDADDVRSDISKTVDNIIADLYGDSSSSGMTKMLTRLNNTNPQSTNISGALRGVMDMFDDEALTNTLLNTYTQNMWIKQLDNQIDTVLKYMPRLKEALSCLKECVLSADHFSKDFLNIHSINSIEKEALFGKRIEELKVKYNLAEFYDELYENTSKYGESYVYVVPYNQEISKLLNSKKFTNNTSQLLSESAVTNKDIDDALHVLCNSGYISDTNEVTSIKVQYNSGYLKSAYGDTMLAEKTIQETSCMSLMEQYKFMQESGAFDKSIIPDDLIMPDGFTSSNDGIVEKDTVSPNSLKIKGCVLKVLERSNILPLYIDNMNMGYYYFEFNSSTTLVNDINNLNYSTAAASSISSYSKNMHSMDLENQKAVDNLLSYVSNRLSKDIDAKFVNANQDLSKEIYMILKHNNIFNNIKLIANGGITITFIPADDVVHSYFRKDPVTHRGISDLELSLFPANLYVSLYVTNTLNTLIRGQDKRVYYIKQNIEANISATMLNTINQIKKGNFGVRQMENLGSMLGILGNFNDYVVPLNSAGDSPIQFEVMPGMKIDIDTDLMDRLEKMAINPTDVPIELIDAKQSLDYAIQATMSNSKLMRKTYKRQGQIGAIYSQIATRLYNYEYDENENINVSLPAPMFLNMTNGAQIISSTVDYVNSLAENLLASEPDEVKLEFKKIAIMQYLPSQIDGSNVDNLLHKARLNVSISQLKNKEQQ